MRLKALAVVVLLGLGGVAPLGQQPADRVGAVEDEILVKFRPQADDARRDAALESVGGRRIKRFKDLDIDHVRIPRGRRAQDAVAAIRANADVVAAQPNYLRSITSPPPPNDFFWINDTANGFWALKHIQTDLVWSTYTTGSSSIVIADIDTGVKYTHPDLAANMWINPGEIAGNGVDDDVNGYVDDVHGINVLGTALTEGNPMDDNGHGTHTAGTFGAVGNNHIGTGTGEGTATVGVNWNAKILACKFLDANGNGSDAGAIECFNYITAMKNRGINIRVSNNSWGGYRNTSLPFPQLLKDAVDAAGNAGIINIFAAGNGGADFIGDNIDVMPHDPASFDSPSIVSVASSDQADARAASSNFGAVSVDLAAPGVQILSTWRGANTNQICTSNCAYARISGTSMATPHVAGVAALLVAQSPSLPVSGIKALLLDNVTPLAPWSGVVATGGRLNAFNAATALNVNPLPTVSITSPLVGAEFTAPADVAITANATDSVSVTAVEFFANGVPLGSDSTPPYSITATAMAAGNYNLTAKATDNLGGFSISAPVPIEVNPPAPSEAAITQTVTSGGLRLQQLQNADGGWYFRATDTGCGANAFAGGSCDNIIGVTGLGLLSAYQRTNDPAVLADAVRAGELLQSIHDAAPTWQPFSQDLEFLHALSDAGAGAQYATLASTWFTTVTTSHPVAADRVEWQFTHRQSLAVWDLASLIRSAKAANRADYATALANGIIARESEWKVGFPHSLIGLGSLLWAIHDLPGFDAQIADYRTLLLAAQHPEGTWGGNLQITAYVALGLGAVGGSGTAGAIQDAVEFFMANQLPNSGWPFAIAGGLPGAEFAMLDSEIVRAIDLPYGTGSGSSVTVTPAQLAAVTFETVSAAGMTSVVATAATSDARVPNGYTLVDGLTYEVATTAEVKGETVMCVSVPWHALDGHFDRLRLMQPRHKKLVDQTIMKGAFAPDAAAKRLCGELSLAEPVWIAMRDRH